MLVQTTVAVGIKRYPRFLRCFPTLSSLARASKDAVLKEWEGLGYYHRARHLHEAARIIRDRHHGAFPSSYSDIRALPGIGDYAAAAIVNFCFEGNVPPIDTNVARVGARLFGIAGDVRSGGVRREVRHRLHGLMSVGRGAVWTDALIELGALVCAPRHPLCPSCPLRSDCRAYRQGAVERFGLPPARPPQRREVNVACGIIRRRDGRVLIAQRPEGGLLPGLWEFPGGKRQGNERISETCRREIQEELGINVEMGERHMILRHAYSHIGCQQFRWVRVAEMSRYAFPAANRHIIAEIERPENQP
ncbi:MAG: A/G-specific adenine glycosylase [candidate division Zixibacteria bacterium]|nr:A/G-specific adenine glycosylase [candidate division Zixibacteria bacterium]